MEFSDTHFTNNGMPIHSLSESKNLDFFYYITRNTEELFANNLFENAYNENPVIALAILFNLRDCRGGKQEKKLPIRLFSLYSLISIEKYKDNLRYFISLGCFIDLLKLRKYRNKLMPINEEIELDILACFIRDDLEKLSKNQPISLAGKWAPTEGSKYDKGNVKRLMKILRFKNFKEYRINISKLRFSLKIPEIYHCSRRWSEIDYPKVPARCMFMNKKSYILHDRERFKDYINDVKINKSKINFRGVQPHEIINKLLKLEDSIECEVLENSFMSIINDIKEQGKLDDCISIIDVSGSMETQIDMNKNEITLKDIAIALGSIIAYCNNGSSMMKFITFSQDPELVYLDYSSLRENLIKINKANWSVNINLINVFTLLIKNSINVKRIFIFSDMEFEWACNDYAINGTAYNLITEMFNESKMKLPEIIFWNLNGKSSTISHVTKYSNGVSLMSGYSSELFNIFLGNENVMSPYEKMMEVLNNYIPHIKV